MTVHNILSYHVSAVLIWCAYKELGMIRNFSSNFRYTGSETLESAVVAVGAETLWTQESPNIIRGEYPMTQ